METNGINYIRHIYNRRSRICSNDLHTEYELIKNFLQKIVLPAAVTIEKTSETSTNNLINSWLCVERKTDWPYGTRVTGLQTTKSKNIFEGNLLNPAFEKRTPGSLIFFEFSKNKEILVIDVFKDFYTDNPFAYKLIFESHQFLLRKKPVTE